jgi:hypothetical protein
LKYSSKVCASRGYEKSAILPECVEESSETRDCMNPWNEPPLLRENDPFPPAGPVARIEQPLIEFLAWQVGHPATHTCEKFA